MKKIQQQKGMALLLVMGVIVVVLTTISIGATLYLNNLDANRGTNDSNQSLEAAHAGIERARGLFKKHNDFFNGCQVNDCINFSNSTCIDCSISNATYTDSQQRYKYKVKIITLNPGGATIQSTGYKGLYNRVINSGLSFYKPFTCGDEIEDGEGNKYSTVAIEVEGDSPR
jgi:type II secretory pathway pseudopilin PulG